MILRWCVLEEMEDIAETQVIQADHDSEMEGAQTMTRIQAMLSTLHEDVILLHEGLRVTF